MGDELRRALAAPRESMLAAIVVRLGNSKHARPRVGSLTFAHGLVGDRWSAFQPSLERQLTVMDVRVVRFLLAERARIAGAQGTLIAHEELDLPGDNLVVDFPTGTSVMPAGTRVRIGTSVVEFTELPHMGCKKFEARFGSNALAWVNDRTHYDLRLRGLNAMVVEEGEVRLGNPVEVVAAASTAEGDTGREALGVSRSG